MFVEESAFCFDVGNKTPASFERTWNGRIVTFPVTDTDSRKIVLLSGKGSFGTSVEGNVDLDGSYEYDAEVRVSYKSEDYGKFSFGAGGSFANDHDGHLDVEGKFKIDYNIDF